MQDIDMCWLSQDANLYEDSFRDTYAESEMMGSGSGQFMTDNLGKEIKTSLC